MPTVVAPTGDVQSESMNIGDGAAKDKMSGSQLRVIHSVCTLDCPDTCGVLVTVDDATGRAVKVAGDPAHPVTRGFLCGKVAKFLDHVYSADRVLYPMRRKPGTPCGPATTADFERVTWDQALQAIAGRLAEVADESGPESILPYSYAGTIGQLGYGSMDRRFFYRLGASQLDRTICSTAGSAALNSVYGTRLGTLPQDFAKAGMVICWGANVHGNNIHLWPFIEQARRDGAKLVVIDPYRTRTAAQADQHLRIHPGTDTLLALAMMHVLLREGLEDRDYIAECTTGFEELRAHALKAEHAPGAVAEATGLVAETIERLALDYGRCLEQTGKPPVIRVNYGIQRSEGGGTAARAVLMLPLLTGAWRHRGGGALLSMSGAFPFDFAALQRPELMQASALGRAARTVNMNQLGHALTQLGQDGREPQVKAMFVYNSNPAVVAPNQRAVLTGMRRDDLFTVVHEQTFTDTCAYADFILPAPTFIEQKEVVGAYGHTCAQIAMPAIAPLGEARTNVDLFAELGRRMGFLEPEFHDGADELIDQALGSRRAVQSPAFAGITRERLEREGHIKLVMPSDAEGQVLPFSTPEWFRTPSRRGELTPVPVYVAPRESRGGDAGLRAKYPLEFLPRKNDSMMNSTFASHEGHRQMEQRLYGLEAGVLEMNRTDADARGLAEGAEVNVINDRGTVRMTLRLSERVTPGVVAGRLDRNLLAPDEQNVNALTSETLTDLGGGATFYSTLVEVAAGR